MYSANLGITLRCATESSVLTVFQPFVRLTLQQPIPSPSQPRYNTLETSLFYVLPKQPTQVHDSPAVSRLKWIFSHDKGEGERGKHSIMFT